jgi:ribosomal protein S18 acetylase RimI-like enzyme
MENSMGQDIEKQFVIRNYAGGDFPEVENLWFDTGLSDPTRGDTSEIIDESIKLGGKLLVMIKKDSGIIVGTSWMTYDGRRIHLHHFAIKPEFQNMGLGKWLTLESLKFAREKNKQIKLEVHKSNETAVHLYQALGFKYLGDYNVYIIRNPQQLDLHL